MKPFTSKAGSPGALLSVARSARLRAALATDEHRMLCRALGMFLAMAERMPLNDLHERAENFALLIENFSRVPSALRHGDADNADG